MGADFTQAPSWLKMTSGYDVMLSVKGYVQPTRINTLVCVRNSKFYRQQCK